VGADSPPAAINPATAAAPDVVSYWRAYPADLVTLTIVKLPEQTPNCDGRQQSSTKLCVTSRHGRLATRFTPRGDAALSKSMPSSTYTETSSPGSNANGRKTFRAK
jgi:hypothetical protein